jgi:hypothetical protein
MKQFALVLLWSIAFGSAASAQPTPERTYRVGVISISAGSIELFRRFAVPELAKRGFVEGRNLTLETRFGEPTTFRSLQEIWSAPSLTWSSRCRPGHPGRRIRLLSHPDRRSILR